jgi:hypothetical protein
LNHCSKKNEHRNLKNSLRHLLTLVAFFLCFSAIAQPVTGVWKGKIDRKNVELKLIKNGDSLTGTSYYYESPKSFRRYSIKGYFDERDNSVVWWDDQLIEEKNSSKLFLAKRPAPYHSSADFNCPGGTKMYLDGSATLKDTNGQGGGPVNLQKFLNHLFNDEWDFVIENYTVGANDPELIDSIGRIAFARPVPVVPAITKEAPQKTTTAAKVEPSAKRVLIPGPTTGPVVKPKPVLKEPVVIVPLDNQQKFATRTKQLMQEIPVSGDSIELRFYDNAEIDGDSIAIFLNNKMLYEHVRLTDRPYTIKLAVADLDASNELVMVAENLGSIPPNTSLMIALINGKRYETRLESTEQSSAVIHFIKE